MTLAAGSIHVEHVWKRFRADKTRKLLRDRISQFSRKRRGDSGWTWVLRDINFEIEPGESVGLVGKNGSGKSTLLKMLTGVMYPYAGNIELQGRVGALLEVRAGLHADLTGRENIYLYGVLLGFDRKTLASRFDEIVDFANLNDAVDRQLKFYSSGMQMRLGFSIAAFLEPDILLVDEALAVGDAFFQQKCLERMRDLLKAGTTLILVSHDLVAIESVCRNGIWLRDGEITSHGPIAEVLTDYRRWIEENSRLGPKQSGSVEIRGARAVGPRSGDILRSEREVTLRVDLWSEREQTGSLVMGITQGSAAPAMLVEESLTIPAGESTVNCTVPYVPLASGTYFLWVEFVDTHGDPLVQWQPACALRMHSVTTTKAPVGVMKLAPIEVPSQWTVSNGNQPKPIDELLGKPSSTDPS